jgi:hypothetical protein
MYPGTGLMVSPGAAMVTTGPGIVDIAIVSMFLVMAASAASTALKGGVDGDDYDGGRSADCHVQCSGAWHSCFEQGCFEQDWAVVNVATIEDSDT